MFVSVICQQVDNRRCRLTAEKANEKFEIELKIPFFKTEKNIWRVVHIAKIKFHKKGFFVTGAQISAALTTEYPKIPYVY